MRMKTRKIEERTRSEWNQSGKRRRRVFSREKKFSLVVTQSIHHRSSETRTYHICCVEITQSCTATTDYMYPNPIRSIEHCTHCTMWIWNLGPSWDCGIINHGYGHFRRNAKFKLSETRNWNGKYDSEDAICGEVALWSLKNVCKRYKRR